VSRTRKAGVNLGFGYLQFALALVSGLVLVPFILARVGTEAYAFWLGYGELVAYSAMVDLGVLGVLPWLIAGHDGEGDRGAMREMVTATFVLATAAALAFCLVCAGLLAMASELTGASPAQREAVLGPILFLAVGMALAYPVRTFHAVLVGLQDVHFTGIVGVLQVVASPILIVSLLLGGFGLYALAAAAVLPSLAGAVASVFRLRRVAPELLSGWRRPSGALLRRILAQGLGAFTGALGWRMVAASNTIILLSTAGPTPAVVYALTAKVGDLLMQLSWQLPDSAGVGLAQLQGEGKRERLREVVLAMVRLTLLGAGAVACAVLAFNPGFVALWTGPDKFGGLALNTLLAGGVLGLSAVHIVFTAAAILGKRTQIGWATLAQGAFHIGAAALLARVFGAEGVAAAGVLSSLVVAYPVGVVLFAGATGVTHARMWREAVGPWLGRVAPLLALGFAVGMATPPSAPWAPLVLAPLLAVLYGWRMRPLLQGLPFPAGARPWMVRFRLVPE
jgi:O-antigen/teichoic acid export membrane protein